MPVLDANVLLRHLTADNSEQSSRASQFVATLQADGQVIVPEQVLFEVAFTLRGMYKRSPEEIRDVLGEVVELQGVRVTNRRQILHALQLHAQVNISLVDAYIAALALESDGQVISFDRDFDRVPGLTRVEP